MARRRNVRVVVLERAALDVEDILTHLELERGADLAGRFRLALEQTVDGIKRFPASGRLRETPTPELREIRWIPIRGFPRYLVHYRAIPSVVEIVRVLHGHRDLEHARFE